MRALYIVAGVLVLLILGWLAIQVVPGWDITMHQQCIRLLHIRGLSTCDALFPFEG